MSPERDEGAYPHRKNENMSVDYKSTVKLPRSSFAMKAGLPKLEPELLERWQRSGLYAKLRAAGQRREKLSLHDGPPYANGNSHIGHALNKILKDVINRCQQMGGKDANYVPGWDCHGLPIEWKIEEKYRAEGKDKDEVPVIQFREECRAFARKWIEVQREEFKRLGIEADWDNPYTTMAHGAEAQIVRELGKFVMNGGLYKGVRPVLWSVVEKTALAEAEVEYHDHTSMTVWVRFPVIKSGHPDLDGVSVVIWTTTPWTLPGNRAVAYGADHDYLVIEVKKIAESSLAVLGERLLVMADLVAEVAENAGITIHETRAVIQGQAPEGTPCAPPPPRGGSDFAVPLVPGARAPTPRAPGPLPPAPGDVRRRP